MIAVLITAVLAPGVLRLRLRTDGLALAPPNRPGAVMDRSIRREFGLTDYFVVVVHAPDSSGIFAPAPLRTIRELTQALVNGEPRVPILSLATERDDRVVPGTLTFRTFLDPIPENPGDLAALRTNLRDLRVYTGTLFSEDESAAAIFVGAVVPEDRVKQYERIRRTVAVHGLDGTRIDVIGPPAAEVLLGFHILEDLGVRVREVHSEGAPPSATSVESSLEGLRRVLGRRIGLLPFSLLLIALIFLLAFRSVPCLTLPLCKAGACLASVLGLMGWIGVPIYLTVAVMPVILTAIGLTDEVHVFSRLAQIRRERPDLDPRSAVHSTMDELARPIVKTAITTAVGFFSFASSSIEPIRVFGIFTGLGVLFCLLWSLTVTPAGMALFSRRAFTTPSFLVSSRFASLAAFLSRRRRLVLLFTAILVALTPFGFGRLEVQDSWIGGFAPASPFFRATKFFDDRFFGTHVLGVRVRGTIDPLTGTLAGERLGDFSLRVPGTLAASPEALIGSTVLLRRSDSARRDIPSRSAVQSEWSSTVESAVASGNDILISTSRVSIPPRLVLGLLPADAVEFEIAPRPFLSPEVLRQVEGFGRFARTLRARAVGGALGPAEYLATTNYIVSGRREEARRIPGTFSEAQLLWEHYSWIRGESRLLEVVSPDFRSGLVTVFLKDANYADTALLLENFRQYERKHLAPVGLRLDFGGDVAVSQDLIDAIVTSQVRSLLLSVAGIFAVLAVLNRSFLWGLYGMLPCALAVATNLAMMGWLGVPLGVATSMFAAMSLGIGDAFSIHLVERYRFELARGVRAAQALRGAMHVAGPAILIDAAAVALGFGILTLSQVPSNARLGMTTLVTVITCLVATLLVLPAILPERFRNGARTGSIGRSRGVAPPIDDAS